MDLDVFAPPHSFMPHLPLTERWEQLRPIISRLYVDENRKLSDVMDTIRTQYGFDAGENQYKYQITKKWKLKKSIPTSKKTEMLRIIGKRSETGKLTTLTYQGKFVDKNKLRRLARTQIKRALGSVVKVEFAAREPDTYPGPVLKFARRIFMNWNMPYGALRSSHARAIDHFSPSDPLALASTPSDVFVATPAANTALSPAAGSPSGLSKALKDKNAVERAHLFIQGKHEELIRSMNKQERVTMSTWLYQFWLFSFKTAKHWGKGPRNWTADLLVLDKYLEKLSISSPNTPGANTASPGHLETPRSHTSGDHMSVDAEVPMSLCHWGIHLRSLRYERISSPPPEEDDMLRDRWADWPRFWKGSDFMERLRNSLESNDFSNVDADGLPVAVPKVLRKARRTSDDLLEEALGFSIMGRNVDLLFEMVQKVGNSGIDVNGLYPFHLAATYLSGSDPCCNVLCCLVYRPSVFSLRKLYISDMGHTILDSLMISVLKAHTNCTPGDVDDTLKRERRFPGEEVDICGRWDADSDCIRALLARGECRIPFDWKHKFCHTSAQCICHCIGILFSPRWKPDINTPSGLFVKRCSDCGHKLQLLPLHTLVMVAFQLAQHGCESEDLFGLIACLLCLLGKGANPLLTAELSLSAFFGTKQASQECDHETINPLELAERVPESFLINWSEEARIGWQVLCLVLQLSHEQWAHTTSRRQNNTFAEYSRDEFDRFIHYNDDAMEIDIDNDGMEVDDDDMSDDEKVPRTCDECLEINFFWGNTDLRDLWAAAQTELLTYRRLGDGDAWTSVNFNLQEILENYQGGHGVRIGLIESDMLKAYCECGRFLGALDEDCACVDEACADYFSNLDIWDRATYLECSEKDWLGDESDEYDSDSEESEELDDEP